MTSADVEVVRRWFAGLERGELSLEICDPEIVISNWEESPVRGPYRGHDGLREWWADFAEVFEDVHLELKEALDVGDGRVVTTQHVVGRLRLTGIDVDGPFGAIITGSDPARAPCWGIGRRPETRATRRVPRRSSRTLTLRQYCYGSVDERGYARLLSMEGAPIVDTGAARRFAGFGNARPERLSPNPRSRSTDPPYGPA
jgi:ketosteroid isomerase-like protein